MTLARTDKEFRKFVDSPTRVDGTAVEVTGDLSIKDGTSYLKINNDGSINVNSGSTFKSIAPFLVPYIAEKLTSSWNYDTVELTTSGNTEILDFKNGGSSVGSLFTLYNSITNDWTISNTSLIDNALQLESGDFILMEDGSYILLE